MKRLTLSVALAVATVVNAFACTNLIVGKNASADGSTIVSLFCRLLWIVRRVISLSGRHAQKGYMD